MATVTARHAYPSILIPLREEKRSLSQKSGKCSNHTAFISIFQIGFPVFQEYTQHEQICLVLRLILAVKMEILSVYSI